MSLQKLGKTKGKSIRRQRHMKKVLAVLVALAMLVTFASALDQFDYIKKVYIDPTRFEQLPAGYSLQDAQYSFLKMTSTDTSGDKTVYDGLGQSAYSTVQMGTSPTTITGYTENALSTSVTGTVVSDVTKQLIWQNGEIYQGTKPVTYDPQAGACEWKFDSWAGYERDQGAVLSGDIQDCKNPTFTVNFLDTPDEETKVDGLHEDYIKEYGTNAIDIGGMDYSTTSLLEAYAGQSPSAEIRHYPMQEPSLTDYTDIDFEATYFAGGKADIDPYSRTNDGRVFVDFSELDYNNVWWVA